MKKFLSLILALSMIISCVSMVSFVVANAEEAQEPIGVKITATEALTGTSYPRAKANFTAADVVWADTNDDTSGYTTRQGSISRTFTVLNNSNGKYYGSIGFYGGNRMGKAGATSPVEGWEGIGQQDITLAAGGTTTVTATFKVYEFAADGAIVVKINSTSDPSKYEGVVGYAPLSTVYLRVNADKNTEANASVIIMPKAGESTVLFNLGNQGKATVTKVYEVPFRKYVDNGDAENGKTGWRAWNSGTVNIIEDPDDATNHIAQFVPTSSIAGSVGYGFENYILQDSDVFLNGKGIGKYTVSFRAKAEAGKGGKFNAMFAGTKASGNYYTEGKAIEMTDQWATYTVELDLTQKVIDGLKANNDYQIGLRLDGTLGAYGSWANPGTPFTYYVDDVTIKHESELRGVEYTVVELPSGGYPLWRGSLGVTEDDAVDNVINLSFDIFNTGDSNITGEFMLQNEWSTISGKGVKISNLAPGYKQVVDFSLKTDGNGNVIKDDGTIICALSKVTIRFQFSTGTMTAGQKALIVGNDDLSAKAIKKAVGAQHQTSGDNKGKFTATIYTGEIPAFGTPTPTPTPTPKPVVKGFQLVALKDFVSTSGTAADYPTGGTGKFTEEDVVWSDDAVNVIDKTFYEALDAANIVQMGTITRKYLVYNNGATSIKAGVTIYGGNRKATGSPATGWDCPLGCSGHAGATQPAMEPQTVKLQTITFNVFKTVDDQVVIKVKDSKTTINGVEVTGYAPLSTVQTRFDFWDFKTGSSVVVAPYETNENDEIFGVYTSAGTSGPGKDGYTKSLVYELPDIQLATPTPTPTPTPVPTPTPTPTPKVVVNGNVENGKTGWGANLGGTTTVETEADGNHVIKHVPAGQYNSASFNIGAAIIQDAEHYYFGNGAGTYTITFRAKAEAGKGGLFYLYINSAEHKNKNDVVGSYTHTLNTYQQGNPGFTMTDEWQTFTVNVDLSAAFLANIYAAAKADDGAKLSSLYHLALRFDGSNKAFKLDGENNYFAYYIDDVTVSYAPPATPTPTPTPKPTAAVGKVFDSSYTNYYHLFSSKLFKNIEFAEGETEKEIPFIFTWTGDETIQVFLRLVPYWGSGVHTSETQKDNKYSYGVRLNLVPGETVLETIVLPKSCYGLYSGTVYDSFDDLYLRVEFYKTDGTTTVKLNEILEEGQQLIIASPAKNVMTNTMSSGAKNVTNVTDLPAEAQALYNNPDKGSFDGYFVYRTKSTEEKPVNYMMTSKGVFSNADIKNGYIFVSETFYNPNDYDINVELAVQADVTVGGSAAWAGPGTKLKLAPGAKGTAIVKVPFNADNITIISGNQITADKLFVRVNFYGENTSTNLPAGAGYVVENTNSLVAQIGTGTFAVRKAYNVPDFKIIGANLELGSTLTVNYATNLGAEYADAYMKVTRNGNVTEIPYTNGTFAYEGINAQCMGDDIIAEIILDGKVIFTHKTYSIKDYALRMYGSDAELNTLLADMLAYGAASQRHTGYKTDAIVNADITWATTSFDATKLEPVRVVGDRKDANNYIRSVGMNISNVYKLYFKFELAAAKGEYTVKLDGVDVTDKVDGGVLYTDAIKATGNKTPYTVELLIGETVVSTVEYNVDAYINSKYENSTVVDIVKAIANYGQAAEAYAK